MLKEPRVQRRIGIRYVPFAMTHTRCGRYRRRRLLFARNQPKPQKKTNAKPVKWTHVGTVAKQLLKVLLI